MTSARTSMAVSGAAQGAAAGSMFGPYGIAIGAGVGFVGGLISGGSADAQFDNQMAWADYNRHSQYNTAKFNAASSMAIAGFNASLARASGQANAEQAVAAATYNASIIALTTEYNVSLMQEDLANVWEDYDLDIEQLTMFRARERGGIVADQAASGTVIGTGSNAAIVIDQQTQEALDATILRHGADREAAGISNSIAGSRWQGNVAIQQTIWEGQMSAYSSIYNAEVQAKSAIGSAIFQANADMYNAKQAFMTGGYDINNAEYNFGQQNQQEMISGLFKAAGTYAAGYYATKIPGATTTTTGTGSSYTPPTIGGVPTKLNTNTKSLSLLLN